VDVKSIWDEDEIKKFWTEEEEKKFKEGDVLELGMY
jgi:hypothetical protein